LGNCVYPNGLLAKNKHLLRVAPFSGYYLS
jgi:hypothetical protein